MKRAKTLCLIIFSLLLFLPFIKISIAQSPYVEIQEGDEHSWKLSVYSENWSPYFRDNLEATLDNLWPLGPYYNMTRVFFDWGWAEPPQVIWFIDVSNIGSEETGTLLLPFGNRIITYTPVFAATGYEMPDYPDFGLSYYNTWYIVDDTSSFLRQTYTLTLSYSVYGIMGVPFVPTTIDWTEFVTQFLLGMNSRGWLYENVSATAKSNGYSLNVPALGFENNSAAIDIDVKYNSKGVLRYYEFSYGEKMLVKYKLVDPSVDPQAVLTMFVTIFISVILGVVGVTIGIIVLMKKRKKHTDFKA